MVWATDAEGRIQGGQRILIDTDGTPVAASNRKPNFANVKGFPGRFPARDAELAKGPLIVAEGPESALAAWEATGLETWTVFGVGGFATAPLPEGREVILAPDRDAPESTAGRAFRQAVAEHLERGHDLRIAMAPEPSGSKDDLNDTLRRAGLAEVKAAIDAARPVQAWLPAELNAGQREAAEAMLGPDRLTLVKGHAGTGKTTALRAVASAWQARGVEVLAGAPSGKATQELARIEGASAATLSAWESRWERGEVPKGPFVFLMDEAGMVGVEQWARVQSRVLAMGGKLVGIGDPEQLRPVGDLPGWAAAAFDRRTRSPSSTRSSGRGTRATARPSRRWRAARTASRPALTISSPPAQCGWNRKSLPIPSRPWRTHTGRARRTRAGSRWPTPTTTSTGSTRRSAPWRSPGGS